MKLKTLKQCLLACGILAVAGGSLAADRNNDGFTAFTPFERIATLPVVLDGSGAVDHAATYTRAQGVATAIASYFALNDEASVLGSDVIQGGNWLLGGLEAATPTSADIEAAILRIPTSEAIDPSQELTSANTKKVNVLDLCNPTYAKIALGASPVVGEETVPNGFIHATALPCEISVYNDENGIYVDMLNPTAIFTLFFTDVVYGDQMQDPQFAAAMMALPTQVEAELKSIVYAALADFEAAATAVSEPMGPEYQSSNDVIEAIDAAPNDSPYQHFAYTRQDGGVFTTTDLGTIAQAIIETMTINGIHEDGLESLLSEGSSWRSARATPLALPGNNKVIEACSPKYAKQALGTGLHHAPALPCEISLNVTDGGATLVVSYLDPNFMFNALFKDAFADMSWSERKEYASLPGLVLADLQAIVAYTMENKLDVTVSAPTQVSYDMLPASSNATTW